MFLLPSLSEGIANVVIEAMALGVPVLSTNCDGMREVIMDEKSGFLIEPRNPEMMAKKIIQINHYNSEKMKKIIMNAKKDH